MIKFYNNRYEVYITKKFEPTSAEKSEIIKIVYKTGKVVFVIKKKYNK